jgi:hypothetical protein
MFATLKFALLLQFDDFVRRAQGERLPQAVRELLAYANFLWDTARSFDALLFVPQRAPRKMGDGLGERRPHVDRH